MTISEKDGLKRKQGVHLAAIVAGLAITPVSNISGDTEYVSPSAKFFSAENRGYSIDCNLEENFLDSKSGR